MSLVKGLRVVCVCGGGGGGGYVFSIYILNMLQFKMLPYVLLLVEPVFPAK